MKVEILVAISVFLAEYLVTKILRIYRGDPPMISIKRAMSSATAVAAAALLMASCSSSSSSSSTTAAGSGTTKNGKRPNGRMTAGKGEFPQFRRVKVHRP